MTLSLNITKPYIRHIVDLWFKRCPHFYSSGVLTCDTFESVDEIEEAIGEVLQSCCDDTSSRSEDYLDKQIKDICDKLFDAINVSVIWLDLWHQFGVNSFNLNINYLSIDSNVFRILNHRTDEKTTNGQSGSRLLAPIHLGNMSSRVDDSADDWKSIWTSSRMKESTVDSKKLFKAEAKLKQKADKRDNNPQEFKPILQPIKEATGLTNLTANQNN